MSVLWIKIIHSTDIIMAVIIPAARITTSNCMNKDIMIECLLSLILCRDLSRVKSLREVNKKRSRKFHIVIDKWVNACMEAEKLVQERPYEPITPS